LFFSVNTPTLAAKIKDKMRELQFKPPNGGVYVRFNDEPEFAANASGIHVRDTSRTRSMSAPIDAVPHGSDVEPESHAVFVRKDAYEVSPGIFFIHEEAVQATIGREGLSC
jgi:hypothetical protein